MDIIDVKAQVLIIDDEPRMCDSLKALLQPENYGITISHSGHQALNLIAQVQFDLILMDYVLPDIPGSELMHIIRFHIQTMNLKNQN